MSQSSNNPPPPPSGSNPTPTITTISPDSTVAGGAEGFTLTINGTNFVAASMVNFGGTAPATTFVSATQLTAAIPAAAIASAGNSAVTVTNPAPGGGSSNAVNFAITSGPNPVPTINSLDQSCAPAGGQAFNLGVFGLNFVASSVVRWNGSDRSTTVLYSFGTPLLSAQIPASDIAAAGTAAVTVFNPAPGGGSSNSLSFSIAAGGAFPQSIAVDPTGKFAYVANGGCLEAFAGNVSMYTINPSAGDLTSVGSPVAADFGARSVTIDPSGKFTYVANHGDFDVLPGSVSMYTINRTSGALTSVGTIAAGTDPVSVAVDPAGKFAYVTNSGSNNVSMYSIDAATGALTSIGNIVAESSPTSIAIHPSGKFAYVTNSGSNSVSMYSIDAATGALTLIGTIGT